MVDFAVPYFLIAGQVLGALLVLIAVWVTIASFVRDYGWDFSRWFKGYSFARGHKLLWWQRKPPMFQMDTRLYVGLPGSGKTLMLTRDALILLRKGVRVLSNYRIVDPLTGRASIVIRSWFDMLAYSVAAAAQDIPTVFVIDEIHLWAPARMFAKTPGWWLGLMAQRRHYGVGVIGSCQAVKQVEVALRRLTDFVVFVRPLVPYRLFGRSLPFFALDEIPSALLGDDGDCPIGAARSLLACEWWVYGGYNTAELVAVEEWAEDEDISARILALTAMAQAATIVDEFHHLDGTFYPGRGTSEEVDELVAVLLEGMQAADCDPLGDPDDRRAPEESALSAGSSAPLQVEG